MKERCSKIIEELINESFPTLRDKKIHVFVLPLKYFAWSIWIPGLIRFILINKALNNIDDFTMRGNLAHELCHQERYIKMGFVGYIRFVISYFASKSFRREEENVIDKMTIEKGYAKELYEVSQLRMKDKKHESIKKLYYQLNDIRTYAEKIGKW